MLCLKASSKGGKVFLSPKCTIETTLPKRHILIVSQNPDCGKAAATY